MQLTITLYRHHCTAVGSFRFPRRAAVTEVTAGRRDTHCVTSYPAYRSVSGTDIPMSHFPIGISRRSADGHGVVRELRWELELLHENKREWESKTHYGRLLVPLAAYLCHSHSLLFPISMTATSDLLDNIGETNRKLV